MSMLSVVYIELDPLRVRMICPLDADPSVTIESPVRYRRYVGLIVEVECRKRSYIVLFFLPFDLPLNLYLSLCEVYKQLVHCTSKL